MTQIIVTLEKDTNPNKLREIIDNLKGVFSTSIEQAVDESDYVRSLPDRLVANSKTKPEKDEWSRTVKQMAGSVSKDKLDLTDDRAVYILSK